jgi:hypothetical protein
MTSTTQFRERFRQVLGRHEKFASEYSPRVLARNLEQAFHMEPIAANLRYIEAGHLNIAAGALEGASVVGQAAGTLGTLAGALVDPGSRSVCYLVVESRRWLKTHRYLLPLGTTRFDPARQALVVDADSTDLQEVEEQRFVPFSDDDLTKALFAPRAA